MTNEWQESYRTGDAGIAGDTLDARELEDFRARTGPFIRSRIEGGISTTSIFEFDDSRVCWLPS
jgi:hypothetical protein